MERSGSERRSHKENAAHGRARQTKPPASQAIGNKSLPLFNRHFSGRGAIRNSYIVPSRCYILSYFVKIKKLKMSKVA